MHPLTEWEIVDMSVLADRDERHLRHPRPPAVSSACVSGVLTANDVLEAQRHLLEAFAVHTKGVAGKTKCGNAKAHVSWVGPRTSPPIGGQPELPDMQPGLQSPVMDNEVL